MCWTATTNTQGSTSMEGKLFWFRPDATAAADFNALELPSGVSAFALKPTWAQGPRQRYGAGGWTANMVMTDDYALWRMGILAPTVVPDVVLAAGPGVTGNIIGYLAWYDEKSDEWSPLSAPSATLVAANQSFAWQTFPTPINPRVTHIGLWRSVDGSLPRLVQLRQIGVSSVTEAVATGDLGEAFVDVFDAFPRCRFMVEWHDRLVAAGNDDEPNVVHFSLIGDREKREFSIKTKSGKPVIGMVTVRGTLIIFTPTTSEIVTGWTVDDIAIEIAQPQIGCVSHHGIQVIHGYAWIPTHLGLYICDGSGWFYVGDDVQTKWISEYRLRRSAYEKSWSVHDPVSMVYKLYVGDHTDTLNDPLIPRPTYWVADYTPVTPQTGGGMGQPRWSYDVSNRRYDSAGVLSVPGGRRSDVLVGTCAGKIFKENDSSDEDDQGDGSSNATGKRMVIRWGAHGYNDDGGDLAQGKRFTDIDFFVKSESNAWKPSVYCGDEYCYPAVVPSWVPPSGGSIPASAVDEGNFLYQPKTVHPFTMPQATGRRAVVEIIADSPVGMEVYGYQISWKEGPATRGTAVSTEPPG